MTEKKAAKFAEAYRRPGDPDWYWKIYHYSGDREVVTARSKEGYATKEGAEDAVAEYTDANDIEAEICF